MTDEQYSKLEETILDIQIEVAKNHENRNVFVRDNGFSEEDSKELTRLRTAIATGTTEETLGSDMVSLGTDWKKVYRELSKIAHPDTGGSHELQLFVNGLNTAMLKADTLQRLRVLETKLEEVNAEYENSVSTRIAEMVLQKVESK